MANFYPFIMQDPNQPVQDAPQTPSFMDKFNSFFSDGGGLLGNDPQAYARNQGLLGMAAQLLQASGPSTKPISFGQALGQGLQGYQQGQQGGLQQAMQARAAMQQKPPAMRERIQGDQQIQEQFDPRTGKWTPIGQGPRWNTKPLVSNTINTGENAFQKGLGQGISKDFVDRRKAAEDAVQSLQGIREARNLLDKGMVSGTFADYRVGLGKTLQMMGINYNSDPVNNAQAFAAAQARQVAGIIKSFGSGTGLSDADREFATKAAGGDINMNEEAIRRILDINERAYTNTIGNYNNMAKHVPQGVAPFPLEVQVPGGNNQQQPSAPAQKQIVRTGTLNGRKVVQYSDGTTAYAD